jgi:CBS domain-containing protein
MKTSDTIVAKDIMASPIICVKADQSLGEVEQCLVDEHVTGLPVVEEGILVGIITRSDYVRLPILLRAYDEYVSSRRYEEGMQQQERDDFHEFRSHLEALTVRDVMTSKVVTCVEETPVSDIAAKMLNHHVHRVVVIDQDRPIGIVGSLELVRLLDH